jgi:RIO-like serine/threonine protein kinase
MVEDFEQDDWDITDLNSRRVLRALSEFEKGLLVNVDMLHKKTGLMPRGLNDAVRHLSKSKLIENPYPSKKSGPYDFYAVEITDLGRQVLEKFG